MIVTLEENVMIGGFGEQVMAYLFACGFQTKILQIGISDEYVEHGNVEILKKEVGIDVDSILKKILSEFIGL